MKVDGRARTSIWLAGNGRDVEIIDQVELPHRLAVARLATLEDAARAIRDMHVRGAPLIGVTAAFGLALALREGAGDARIAEACRTLVATRPTAVNLRWALERMRAKLAPLPPGERMEAAYAESQRISDEDVAQCRAMARHGLGHLHALAAEKGGEPLNVLTHCNAGWLAAVDWGTATAPVYAAHEAGLPVHVFVDETRPRNQGAALTAWELGQHGRVDCVIVGTDRTTATGDVCNKVGTYLKALAAHANGVPFYVAAPSSSIDFAISDGVAEIPIEQRGAEEVTHIAGLIEGEDRVARIRLTPPGSPVANYAFDVTPAALVTGGLITERGVVAANREALAAAFPERVV